MSRVAEAKAALMTGVLVNFMPQGQRNALLLPLRGEERDGIADIVMRAVDLIKACPMTYQTEEVATKDKIAQLHYFRGGIDAWIVERDIGDGTEEQGLGEQIQAFGKITLTGNKADAEWGYISIQEMIEAGVELDLYWTPQNVKLAQECK